MDIEFEATFENIHKESIRSALKKSGARLVYPEFLMQRTVFTLPSGHEIPGAWVRIRKEKDKITMSLKIVDGNQIEDQKEICLAIDDYDKAKDFLAALGCKEKAFQESRREMWSLMDTEITIDEWPFLEPFIEIEGSNEDSVKAATAALGLDYSRALFCAVGTLYNRKYGVDVDIINNHTPLICFNTQNPFLSYAR